VSTPAPAVVAALARRQGMRPIDYPTTVDWWTVSGPVRGPHSTVPTAPPERDHLYQDALRQQQQRQDEG
jgi:hypothetical protein